MALRDLRRVVRKRFLLYLKALINKQKLVVVIATRVVLGQVAEITQLQWLKEAFPQQRRHPPECALRDEARVGILVHDVLVRQQRGIA